MKTQNKIPVGKVARATKFAQTGLKLSGNVVKHYVKRVSNQRTDNAQLHEENAEDVFNLLSNLKGGALKVAQMLSMDKNMLPTAYSKKFELSQFSAPPLSGPLVLKTFKTYFGKSPSQLFDTFDMNASNAASIGQVHRASLDGKSLAVKIQYPGVRDSLKTDLLMAKPIASKLMSIPASELEMYMTEVESKLLEETDYALEFQRSVEISSVMKHHKNLVFPNYYSDLSSEKILTMDWIEGTHISEFINQNPSQEERNFYGQIIWDFYQFQIHKLKKVHADPHPGNFLITNDNKLGVLDFGCVKEIPHEFYSPYFELMLGKTIENPDEFYESLLKLDLIRSTDSEENKELLLSTFHKAIGLIIKPLTQETFDFSDNQFFEDVYNMGENMSKSSKLRKLSGRGNQHAIYVNRTYFGLYNLLHVLGAQVKTSLN
jgi:predicted unusual protein kinase regulating ubiquinone biosynthesis (AarF/ABC1/UbiB family)